MRFGIGTELRLIIGLGSGLLGLKLVLLQAPQRFSKSYDRVMKCLSILIGKLPAKLFFNNMNLHRLYSFVHDWRGL